MKRISVLIGTWASVVLVVGVCLAAEPRRPGNQPAAGTRSVPPNNSGFFFGTPARAAAYAAAQNAAHAAANTAPSAQQNNTPPAGYYRNSPYGYNNPYSPYGYSPYGYTFYPLSPYGYSYPPYGYMPGMSPYAPYNPLTGYSPLTSPIFLYPYAGVTASYYPQYGYLGYGYPSAVFASPGQPYGVAPIQQLMGTAPWLAQPQANANAVANGNGNAANANPGFANNNNAQPNAAPHDANPPLRKPAVAGGKAMEIAWKFITYGDAHFGNQKFNDALDRYRHAANECPSLSDAWFRQGFALAALGRYEQAAKAMRRGLEEKPDWADNNFRLSEIYGDAIDKKSTLNKIVRAAEEAPTNGDLAFVVGVHLYCDDKADEAAPFFRRAAQIRGSDAEVKSFLPKGQ